MNSTTDFSSPEEEPSNTSQNYNLGLNFTSDQNSKMKLVGSFKVDKDNVKKFKSLLDKYDEQDKTYNMTMKELIYYVMDLSEDDDTDNGTSRLLLN